MTLTEAVIEAFEGRLAEKVRHAGPIGNAEPVLADCSIAMSALQKAVRRNRTDLALSASANLLAGSVAWLCRRLIVIAFEDGGIADVGAVGLVTVGPSSAKLRTKLGGDCAVAEYLLRRMCRSGADRSADGLVFLLELCPSLEEDRAELPALSVRGRIGGAINCTSNRTDNCPERCGLAAWFAIGTKTVRDQGLALVDGCPESYFDILLEAGMPGQVVEISRLAFRKTRCIMSVMLPLLRQTVQGGVRTTADDELPPERPFGEVPSWVLDVHARPGLAAMYLQASSRMRRFVSENFPGAIPSHRMIGDLVFRMESGLCARRLQWGDGRHLQEQADRTRVGLDPDCTPRASPFSARRSIS